MNTKAEIYLDSQYGKLSEELKKAYLAGQNIVYVVTKDYSVVRKAIENEPIFCLRSQQVSRDISTTQSKPGISATEQKTSIAKNLFFGEEELARFNPKTPSICIVTVESKNISNDNLPNTLNKYLKLFIDNITNLSSKNDSENDNWKKSMVIVVTPIPISVPEEIALYCRIIRVQPPSEHEIQDKIMDLVKKLDGNDLSNKTGYLTYIRRLTNLTKGLSLHKISQIFSRIKSELDYVYIPTDNKGFEELEKIIQDEKSQLIANSAILKLIKVRESGKQTSGMEKLTSWLSERKSIIQNPDKSLVEGFIPQPNGILLSGIPGTGKSLAAKATARGFGGLPLLQLDMGNILDKYQGESEHKMEDALKLAESMSPCVLWIDEIEKGIAGVSGDSSGSESVKRIFGKLLTWMQEKEERGLCCFVFATANSIDSIPPELFRSGRFDEKFYTFLPSSKECIEIFLSILSAQDKAYMKLLEKTGNEVRHLFDNKIMEDYFINEILSSPHVLVNKMSVDDTKVSKENKFMTGADIEAVINRAKLILYHEKKISPRSASYVYSKEAFRSALYQALSETRTYGQTNAKQIAECFALLSEYNFQPVSGNAVVPFDFFDPTVGSDKPMFNLQSEMAKIHMEKLNSEYDRQLFLYTGLSINQYLKKNRKTEY